MVLPDVTWYSLLMETPDVEGAINIEGGDKVGFKRCHIGIASGNNEG